MALYRVIFPHSLDRLILFCTLFISGAIIFFRSIILSKFTSYKSSELGHPLLNKKKNLDNIHFACNVERIEGDLAMLIWFISVPIFGSYIDSLMAIFSIVLYFKFSLPIIIECNWSIKNQSSQASIATDRNNHRLSF